MLTVPQAAKRVRRNPETVRRWIREGKLRSQKIGTQHFVNERDLDAVLGEPEVLPLPKGWPRRTLTGEPMPNPVLAIHRAREGR